MASRNVGPRSGDGAREGAYQFPVLAAEVGLDLSAWRGEQIELVTEPTVAGELLFFLFVDDVATLIDETTASAGGPPVAKVPEAPSWIGGARGSSTFVSVPNSRDRIVLKLKPETGSPQRVTVRQAEG